MFPCSYLSDRLSMFRFFKRKSAPETLAAEKPVEEAASESKAVEPADTPTEPAAQAPAAVPMEPAESQAEASLPEVQMEVEAPAPGWFGRLRSGLRKTGAGLTGLFVGSKIDESLFEELESALIMADAGMPATTALLADLRRRVKSARAETPAQVRGLLADALADLLGPLQKPLDIGRHSPTVLMMVGVNGAGKTTTIGKLTQHLLGAGEKVLLAAGDTFRAAAREQLVAWGQRNAVQVIAQDGGDPAAVAFDAVSAGKARGMDVVIVDTAGRLPTQLHLMEELRKVKRVVAKAMDGAPHEVLLVIDANNGQNALAQVRAFDDALGLTGLVITKLDGSAKGGVIAAIARERPVPVYFIGVGEGLEDLQTFDARAFARALVGE